MKLTQSSYLFRSCTKPSSRPRKTQETSRPHILHLGSLVIPRLLRFSISLSLRNETRSFRRARRTVFSEHRLFLDAVFTGDACLLRSLLLSLAPIDSSLSSSILRESDKIPTHRRLSSPAFALTASAIDISGLFCSFMTVSLVI